MGLKLDCERMCEQCLNLIMPLLFVALYFVLVSMARARAGHLSKTIAASIPRSVLHPLYPPSFGFGSRFYSAHTSRGPSRAGCARALSGISFRVLAVCSTLRSVHFLPVTSLQLSRSSQSCTQLDDCKIRKGKSLKTRCIEAMLHVARRALSSPHALLNLFLPRLTLTSCAEIARSATEQVLRAGTK
jgi:hypothetical protein